MRWKECNADVYQQAPSPRLGHTAVLVDARASWGEELLVIYGGLNAEKQPVGDLLVLQTASEAWLSPATATAGPPARAFHCAAAAGSRMFVFGGHVFLKDNKGIHKFNDLWCLNTDNWEWSAIRLAADSPQPSPRDFLAMTALPGGKILVFGGMEANEKRSDETWIFDTAAVAWKELELPLPRPKARYAHTLVQVETRVLLCGGGGENATTVLGDLWMLKGVVAFEDAEPCWVPLEVPGPAPSPRKAHATAAVGWHVVVHGGHAAELGWFRSKTDHYFSDVAVMDRQGTVQWRAPTVEGEAPSGREFHTLTTVSPTRLLMFGGGNGKSIFSDAWWLCMDDDVPQAMPSSQAATGAESARRVPAPAASAKALSEVSEASSAPEQSAAGLGSAASKAQAANDAGEAGDVALPGPEARERTWWSGSPDAEKLSQLLQRLHVPAGEGPLGTHGHAAGARSFELLGRRLCWETDKPRTTLATPDSRRAVTEREAQAARDYLRRTAPQNLRLGDVEAIMWDLRNAPAGASVQSGAGSASLEEAMARLSGSGHRFSHLQAGELRLGDFAALQASYKAKLQHHQLGAAQLSSTAA